MSFKEIINQDHIVKFLLASSRANRFAGCFLFIGKEGTGRLKMAKEFAKYQIRVNTVIPGLIETRFHERFSTSERKETVARQTPLGRNGTAEDVAKAILFLASNDAAAFITGEYVAVNGGLYMRA